MDYGPPSLDKERVFKVEILVFLGTIYIGFENLQFSLVNLCLDNKIVGLYTSICIDIDLKFSTRQIFNEEEFLVKRQ